MALVPFIPFVATSMPMHLLPPPPSLPPLPPPPPQIIPQIIPVLIPDLAIWFRVLPQRHLFQLQVLVLQPHAILLEFGTNVLSNGKTSHIQMRLTLHKMHRPPVPFHLAITKHHLPPLPPLPPLPVLLPLPDL